MTKFASKKCKRSKAVLGFLASSVHVAVTFSHDIFKTEETVTQYHIYIVGINQSPGFAIKDNHIALPLLG
jgi:hypothetical protein